MKKVIFSVLFMLLASSAHSDITTKKQADEFLEKYCVALINEISKADEKLTEQAAKEDWDGFYKTGAWISGVAYVYSKLCK